MLNKTAVGCLEGQLSAMNSSIKSGVFRKRNSWQLIDKYLQKTGDYTADTTMGQVANQVGDKSKISNIEIPVVFINKETAHAYLAGTFLSGYPIFSAVASRANEDAANMMTALVGRDQQRMQWGSELLRGLDDVLRYNVIATEILWKNKRGSGVTSSPATPTKAATGIINPIVYSGNAITRIDPYNLILDPNVEPSRVHIDGTYAGYIELMDYIQLKRLYLEWEDICIVKMNIRKIFGGTTNAGTSTSPQNLGAYTNYTNLYYKPIIAKSPTNSVAGNGDFTHFFGFNASIKLSDSATGRYEVVTMYKRLIPKEYEMIVPNSGNPQVFKLIWVNGYLAYVEPISAGHEYLPIVVGQLYPGDLDVKSFCEYITDLQDLSTSLMTATLQSMRRAVGDRAIYDPTRIRKADIEAVSPVSKIPVSCNAYQEGIESAYKQIPYTDNISGNFQNLMQVSMGLAEKTTGLNQSAQGNFIPGNKTVKEFSTIMSNSQARLQLGAVHLEGNFFGPVKEILKLNYLVHSKTETVTDQVANSTVAIDPAMLRDVAPDFKMADGIMPATKQASTEVIMSAVAAIQNNPNMNLEYDTGGMISSVLKQQGFTNINEYKRTEQQQQQYMGMLQAQAAAAAGQQPQAGSPVQQPATPQQ